MKSTCRLQACLHICQHEDHLETQLVRNPALASHLKPVQSVRLEDGKEPLVLSRRKRVRLTAEQIHAELDRLCEGAPVQDAQAALHDLRQ